MDIVNELLEPRLKKTYYVQLDLFRVGGKNIKIMTRLIQYSIRTETTCHLA
jgi:hypothetical protein